MSSDRPLSFIDVRASFSAEREELLQGSVTVARGAKHRPVVGERFGMLTIVALLPNSVARVRCECGSEMFRKTFALVRALRMRCVSACNTCRAEKREAYRAMRAFALRNYFAEQWQVRRTLWTVEQTEMLKRDVFDALCGAFGDPDEAPMPIPATPFTYSPDMMYGKPKEAKPHVPNKRESAYEQQLAAATKRAWDTDAKERRKRWKQFDEVTLLRANLYDAAMRDAMNAWERSA